MVEECTINVGFHSNFGTFRQSGRMNTPLRSAIINRIPFNPTYRLPLGTISLLLMFLPLGCDYDGKSAGGDGDSSVLVRTIPSNGGVLLSQGTLYMTFSDWPGVVIVNGELATVAGNIAIWNASGLTSGQTVVLFITWTGNGGGIKTVFLTII